MGKLRQDIDAVKALFDCKESLGSFGFFEDIADIEGLPLPRRKWQDFAWIERKFQSPFFADDDRIAIVYLDRGPFGYDGAWAAAARDCLDGIAGVLVLMQDHFAKMLDETDLDTEAFKSSRETKEERARYFLGSLPRELFDAGMPVILDESDVFCEFSPASVPITSEDLVFEKPENACTFIHGDDVESFVAWIGRECIWPIVKVEGGREALAAQEVSCRAEMNAFSHHFHWDAAFNASQLAYILDFALPGCCDRDLIDRIDSVCCEPMDELADFYSRAPYLVAVDKFHLPEYLDLKRELSRIEDLLFLIEAALRNNPDIVGEDPRSDLGTWCGIVKTLCDREGIAWQVKALDAGVPREDIAA